MDKRIERDRKLAKVLMFYISEKQKLRLAKLIDFMFEYNNEIIKKRQMTDDDAPLEGIASIHVNLAFHCSADVRKLSQPEPSSPVID